jgi:hypothetical protein
MTADPVVAFYSGGVDHQGRTLAQVLTWPDDRLEAVHDYIQWLFPTVSPSGVNPFAPLVTDATCAAFAARPALRQSLLDAFDRMLAFYGLLRTTEAAGTVLVEPDPARFEARAANWLQPGNHNHLRLTRIMDSLARLGLPTEARALQQCLLTRIHPGPGARRILPETIEFWRQVV